MSDEAAATSSESTAQDPVIVVGAGMAGLVAAVSLHESGLPVKVFEAESEVGGRIRTERHEDGFLLDRGFQVLLDAYPAARRWVDHAALRPNSFDAGALLWTGRRVVPVADPLRHPTAIPRDLTTRLFPFGDKLRLAALGTQAAAAPWQTANEAATSLGIDVAASEYLWSRGFSEAFVDRFARPFWGGITLDPHLSGSAGPLLFTLKMFLRGSVVLPADGAGAMPAQLLARLPADTIALDSRVTSILVEDGRATGVRVARRKIPASAVIAATDPPALAKLTELPGLSAVQEGLPSLTVYLAGTRPPSTGPRLVLDATRRLVVNHLAPQSEVQPAYAPEGQHLLAAVVIGEAAKGDPEKIASQARDEAAAMLGHQPEDWRVLETVSVPFSQFAQPPGIYRRLPGNVTPIRGLFLASEATVDSSYNGAISSGETAADIARRELAFAAVAGYNSGNDGSR